MTPPPASDRAQHPPPRRAIVTGATSGIGLAITENFLAAGFGVVGNGRSAERLAQLQQKMAAQPGALATVAGDAADEVTISALIAASHAQLLGAPDLCVVNAGQGAPGTLLESDAARWEELIQINILGAARQLRGFATEMLRATQAQKNSEQKAWDIVVIGSSLYRDVVPEVALYNATKQALANLAESLRREVASHAIRVTHIAPGLVTSGFQHSAGYDDHTVAQLARQYGPFLQPHEVAEAVAFVISRPPHVHINDLTIRPTAQSIA
ncbi:SDR family NAD(P)-dependent oxidoreductase [Magnetofaba australis]|uniref:Putative short-chain alcohol dehydrogenase n=1 Tax=Magnetofaba australis IT-1 TaxID=1434232 RepID=A0A1Y2K5D6_9PROT|nr:SDR family NAD(P)-dependent oxidoreductase [Magnetofaba australis]OSM04891.1 putative short-chain alcohol dehydrogenase [Magnetofaba australis IT-1]